MNAKDFVVEVDGRRLAVDVAQQRVGLLGATGEEVSSERIQTAAGSLQGIFSMLEGVTGVKNV